VSVFGIVSRRHMTRVDLRTAEELMPHVERTLACMQKRLAVLVPGAECHHVGATAIPGAVTKGDVDVLVRVSPAGFSSAVGALSRGFVVKQPDNWTTSFASFGDDTGGDLPLGIQLVVRDSENDFLLYLRDYLIANRAALDDYNCLKRSHALEGAEGYWQAKNAFLEKIVASRGRPRLSLVTTNLWYTAHHEGHDTYQQGRAAARDHRGRHS
jgi:GrpB-like predicted nucleotidyltransferase (UPF0157 family)